MQNKLYYQKPAKKFIEAQPIGNGSFGAMAYGGICDDKISFNHDTLWSGKYIEQPCNGKQYETYLKVKKLVQEGDDKTESAENSLIDNFFGEDSQAYMPMCYMTVKSSIDNYSEYKRILDMKNGVVNVSCDIMSKQYFISYPDNCFAMRINTKTQTDYVFGLESKLMSFKSIKDNIMLIKGECPSANPGVFKGSIDELFDGSGIKFTCAFYFDTDGNVSRSDDNLTIKNARCVTVYSCVRTSFTEFNKPADKKTYDKCIEDVVNASQKGYDAILKRHTDDFSEMFDRVVLDLYGECDLTCDEMLKLSDKPVALYELLFNFGKYLIISGSRDEHSQALGLQGIWNEEFTPPWNGAYTANINLEMCYWPMLMCNYAECALPIIKHLEKLSETGENVARHYFHADGYTCFHNSDIWGFATPVGKYDRKYGCGYGYWCMSVGWLCRHAFEQYEYTDDLEILKRIYPLLKGAVNFYISILSEYNGKLIISPSTSPENFYLIGDRWSALGIWTTMTQTILTELFQNFKKACEILECDKKLHDKVGAIIPKLDVFNIGSRGQLLEWDKENTEAEPNHRHVSHLYGLYPGELFTKEKRADLYAACKKSLEIRGDNGTGWSLAWKANLWASLKNGDKTLFFIDKLLNFTDFTGFNVHDKGGVYSNLFCAHPPFQIDGNFGGMAAIARLFMQCEDNRIKILPALPKKLNKGKIKGLLAKGNIITDISWENGRLSECTMYSGKDIQIEAEYNGVIKKVDLTAKTQKLIMF